MTVHRNAIFYLVTGGLFILLKVVFIYTDTGDLAFLLRPTNYLVSLLTSSESVFTHTNGYFHPSLNIVIDKSCSGFNLMLICFVMFGLLSLKYAKNHAYKSAAIVLSMAGAYLFTVTVNSFRIFASIIVQHGANRFLPVRSHLVLHEVTGVATNLVFLVLIYFLAEKFLTRIQPHEKFT